MLVAANDDRVPRPEIFQALNDPGMFFPRIFRCPGQRAGADAGKEWISGASKPRVARSISGIEGIRLLECSTGALETIVVLELSRR